MIVVTNTIQIKSGFGERVAERFRTPKGFDNRVNSD
jgi:heme oxygenase (staphylobilin-producing)